MYVQVPRIVCDGHGDTPSAGRSNSILRFVYFAVQNAPITLNRRSVRVVGYSQDESNIVPKDQLCKKVLLLLLEALIFF